MTYFHRTTPTARKPHRCNLCGRMIRPGETYHRGAGMDGGTAWTWRECAHCYALIPIVDTIDGEYGWPDDFADWTPYTIPHARLRAMWRRRWTRADGTLYPVPVVVWHEDKHGFRWPIDARPGEAS